MILAETNTLRAGNLGHERERERGFCVEPVANPAIVLMDGPTSGLDARAAAIVMRTVRNIVNIGRTIVCMIHQPNIDIFESFDEVFPSSPVSNFIEKQWKKFLLFHP